MRIAVLSDIHGNLQAWHAVQADVVAQGVDRIICLGDVVGYGPAPAEVLGSAYAHIHTFVLGNHDAVVAALMQADSFNPNARHLIEWAGQQLGDNAQQFFRGVPLAAACPLFRCTHGSPYKPSSFNYIVEEEDARLAWGACEEPVVFVGHTHQPCLHILGEDGTYRRRQAGEKAVRLNPVRRYIVNVGSVGIPRDRDFRSAYAVFDTQDRSLLWRRIPFDLEAFTAQVRQTYGESPQTDFLLARFDEARPIPLRESMDFSPGRQSLSSTVVREEVIADVQQQAARWRRAAVAAFTLLLLLGGLAIGYFHTQPIPLTAGAMATDTYRLGGHEEQTWDLLPAESTPANTPPRGWCYQLDDSRHQRVESNAEGIRVFADAPAGAIEIRWPQLNLGPGLKVRFAVAGTLGPDYAGPPPALAIDHVLDSGEITRNAWQQALNERDGELEKQYTLRRPPQSVVALHLRLRAEFSGSFTLRRCTATAIPRADRQLAAGESLDINAASAQDLARLPGIGEVSARRIVQYRQLHGPFLTVEDLLAVKGIGPRTLEAIDTQISIAEPAEERAGITP